MRPLELYAFLGLACLLAASWLGAIIGRGVPVWVPAGLTALAVIGLMVRIIVVSVRQD